MQHISKNIALFNGDCTELIKSLPDYSVHLTVSSFPFANLYTYSDDVRDYSNVDDLDEYFEQLKFLIPELYRVTVPGRDICLHLKQVPTFKGRDGKIGLVDFRGMMIRAFEECGWTYWDDISIWTDPQIEATRTKASSILFHTYKERAEMTRTGMQDILVIMKKWSDEGIPVTHEHSDINFRLWTQLASPDWMDIDRVDVLNAKICKDDKDEKHMTPLQLGLIRKLVNWRTNKGEIVFDPFSGVGSVPYVAVQEGRKGVGFELKPAYFNQSVKYAKELEDDSQMSLFDFLEV